jgi:hypothetical protein
MGRKSDEYFDKIKGALPVTEEEDWNFERGMEARGQEELADAVAERVVDAVAERVLAQLRTKRPGAPGKAEADIKLLEELMNKHQTDTRHARKEFLDVIYTKDGIQKKRANERYRAALKALKARNT